MNERKPVTEMDDAERAALIAGLDRNDLISVVAYIGGADPRTLEGALTDLRLPREPAQDDEPVPYVPAPHIHTFSDRGWCTVCETTLDDWQQLMHGALADVVLGDETARPVAGSFVPGMTGYVTGNCGHPVAAHEWRAGFRSCEQCGDPARDAAEQAHIALEEQ
jgi:hypothetical protein